MTANTDTSASWPECNETSPIPEQDAATTKDALRLCATGPEVRQGPLPAAVRDALHVALLAQPAVGVLVCDARGAVTTMNERLEEMAGQRHLCINVDEWPRRYHLHGPGSDTPLEPAQNPLAIALSGGDVTNVPVVLALPGHPRRPLRCTAMPLRGPDGAALGGLALFVDIDVEVPVQPPSQASPADDRLLVETVEHEMRTPLTCVIGHLELLADLASELRGDARWSWEALVRGATRLQAAVDNLTQPSRSACREPEAQKGATQPAPLASFGESTRNQRSSGRSR